MAHKIPSGVVLASLGTVVALLGLMFISSSCGYVPSGQVECMIPTQFAEVALLLGVMGGMMLAAGILRAWIEQRKIPTGRSGLLAVVLGVVVALLGVTFSTYCGVVPSGGVPCYVDTVLAEIGFVAGLVGGVLLTVGMFQTLMQRKKIAGSAISPSL